MRYILALLVLAGPAFAQDQDAIAAMTVAIQEAGCVVTADNGDAVLAVAGLSADETMAVIAALYDEGLVALQEDGSMKLTNDVCQ